MRRSDRLLLAAALVSVAVHLLALFGAGPFRLGAATSEFPAPPPIEVRLTPPPPPPAPVAQSRKRVAEARRARPRAAKLPSRAQEAVLPQYESAEVPIEYPVGPFDAVASGDAGAAPTQPAVSEAESPPAVETPPPVEYPLRHATLVFDLYYGAGESSPVGEVVHTWTQDGREYRIETVAEAVGFVSWFLGGRLVQRARGALVPGGLEPAAYRAELGAPGRAETARFDWGAHKLALASKGEERLIDLPDGAQDPLSMLHQLYFLTPLPDAAPLDIVTGRKLYRYVYRTVGEAQLETPLGVVRALHMHRQDPDGASMDVWLDRERSFLPARIHAVDRKGRLLRQEIRAARLELADAPR